MAFVAALAVASPASSNIAPAAWTARSAGSAKNCASVVAASSPGLLLIGVRSFGRDRDFRRRLEPDDEAHLNLLAGRRRDLHCLAIALRSNDMGADVRRGGRLLLVLLL